MSSKSLIPRLRFPEFAHSGAWEEKTLGIACSINPEAGFLPDEFFYIDLESVESGKLLKFKQISKQYAPSRAQRLLNENDLLFQMVRPYQMNNYFFSQKKELNCVASTGYAQIRCKKNNPYFVYSYLHNPEFVRLVLNKCTGTSYPAINTSDFKDLVIFLPSLLEQQKIADFLSSLDELITLQSEKLEKLKQHKKGLLQGLFPEEGAPIPCLRFPEFAHSGAWEEKSLGEVGNVVTGNTPSKENNEFWGGDFIWVTAQDFNHKYILTSTLKLTNKGKNKSKIIPKDSVLVTCIASIGLNGINKVECATNQQINAVTCNRGSFFEFVYYNMEFNKVRLRSFAGQTAVPIIKKTVFESFKIKIPTIQEQQKIADCLSSLDELITLQIEKIEKLKQHKKGLLQGLFPQGEA